MKISVQLPDAVYAKLLNGNTRIQGTLALMNPTEGNFNAHNKTWRRKPGMRYMCLPHGKVSITDTRVRLNLSINRDECINAPQAILGESIEASSFLEVITDPNLNSL
jgi:hypothetical protein